MEVLILGGTGTISQGIAKQSIIKGYKVTIVNRGNMPFRTPDEVRSFHFDVYNDKELIGFLSEHSFDIIVDPLTYDSTQMERMVEIISRFSLNSRYFFISSVCAFGESKDVINEQTTMSPESRYGIQKMECENYLRKQNLIKYTIVRPGITYGDIRIPIPFSSRKNPYTVIERVKKEKPLISPDYRGKAVYHNIMHIDDFSKYFVELFSKSNSENNDYIICSSNKFEWETFYTALYLKLDKPKHVYYVDEKCLKYLDTHLYEDFRYHKNSNKCLCENKKIIDETGLSLVEVEPSTGINELVDYLDHYYSDKPEEKNYDLITDALLMFCVSEKDDFLTSYIKSFSKEYRKNVRSFYKRTICSNRIRSTCLFSLLRKVRGIVYGK